MPATAEATLSHAGQSVSLMGLGFMPSTQRSLTASLPMTPRIYAMALSMVSAGLSRILLTMEALGGMTFEALLPCIWVKATVVRIRAFNSPPCFLHRLSSTPPKSQRLAKIMR